MSYAIFAVVDPGKTNIIYHSNDNNDEKYIQKVDLNTDYQLIENPIENEGYKFKSWNTKADGSGIVYQSEDVITITEDITLYAIWEEEFDYIINNYSVDYTNNYISNVFVNTTVDSFKNNIILGNGYSLNIGYREINNNRVLYTGSKIQIYKGDKIYREFTNVVIGDINGDGMINSADLLRIRQHLLGSKPIS